MALLKARAVFWFGAHAYLRVDQSLGAAHWVAQWARWKTISHVSTFELTSQTGRLSGAGLLRNGIVHTLLNAVLLSTTLRLLACHALNALIVVMLGWGALLGVLAIYYFHLLATRTCGNKGYALRGL